MAHLTESQDAAEGELGVSFSRLNELVEFVKHQTLAPSKNHNASPGFELCLKDSANTTSITQPTKRTREEDEDVKALAQFVWLKI
jgi:hypothetical protein